AVIWFTWRWHGPPDTCARRGARWGEGGGGRAGKGGGGGGAGGGGGGLRSGRAARRAGADAAQHVRVGAEAPQIGPVALARPEGEAVAAHRVRDLAALNQGVREQPNEIRLAERGRVLRHGCGRPAREQQGRQPNGGSHGRGQRERSKRRSTASMSEYNDRSRAPWAESSADACLRAAL